MKTLSVYASSANPIFSCGEYILYSLPGAEELLKSAEEDAKKRMEFYRRMGEIM